MLVIVSLINLIELFYRYATADDDTVPQWAELVAVILKLVTLVC